MKPSDYIRAWKDPDYRASLSAEQRAALPEHPCAEIELGDEDLALVAGAGTNAVGTAGCCSPPPDTSSCPIGTMDCITTLRGGASNCLPPN